MSDREDILQKLRDAVVTYKTADAASAANEAIAAGLDPAEAINEGLVKGMNVIGEEFSAHRIYLPQMLAASRAMYAALDILLPNIPQASIDHSKRVSVAVVEGDVHDIGKNIVKTELIAGGYFVNDLGFDVPSDEIVDKVREGGSEVLALSAIMTSTMENMKDVIDELTESGLRDRVTVTIGGAPTSAAFATSIGADHRDQNGQDLVKWLKVTE